MKLFEALRKDFLRKELAPVKILMFLIYGGQATLYPYFTVHLESLGINIEQTAIIFALQPVIALIVAPLVGMLADRIGNFKLIFSFFLIFSAITSNLLLLVPPVEENNSYVLRCGTDSEYENFQLVVEKSRCEAGLTNADFYNKTLSMKLSSCSTFCTNKDEETHGSRWITLERNLGECEENCNEGEQNENCAVLKSNASFNAAIRTLKDTQSNYFAELHYIEYQNETFHVSGCKCQDLVCNTTCSVQTDDFEDLCPEDRFKFSKTFWFYLGIRMVVTLGIGLVNGLFDAASMTIVQKMNGDVGFQRFWATVSMCIFAPASGVLVDHYGGENFTPCFFMYGALYTLAAITSLFLDLSMKLPSEQGFSDLITLLKNPEVFFLLFHVAFLGICWGFLENFLFLFLKNELHSNNLLMGLTVTVGSGTGLFMALVSTWFCRKFGYVNIVVLAFLAYSVRFLGYAKAQDPYVCLIYEMLENFTLTLLTVGVTLYCTELASLKMLTTMMTLWNGLHVISGRAFGSLLGGFMMSRFGARTTFTYFAYGSGAFGFFYFVMNNVYLLKFQKEREEKDSFYDRRRSSALSNKSDIETSLSQAMATATMHCSFDSPVIITYSDYKDVSPQRRRMTHTGLPNMRNSLRRITAHARPVRSLSLLPTQSLPTVFEAGNERERAEQGERDPEEELTRF